MSNPEQQLSRFDHLARIETERLAIRDAARDAANIATPGIPLESLSVRERLMLDSRPETRQVRPDGTRKATAAEIAKIIQPRAQR